MLPRSISQNPSGLLVSFLRVLIRTSLSFLLMESLYQGGVGALHFHFFKDCFVNLNDLFLPSLSLGSTQQSCSFKFKARFIWCFLPPPPLPVDRCVWHSYCHLTSTPLLVPTSLLASLQKKAFVLAHGLVGEGGCAPITAGRLCQQSSRHCRKQEAHILSRNRK